MTGQIGPQAKLSECKVWIMRCFRGAVLTWLRRVPSSSYGHITGLIINNKITALL